MKEALFYKKLDNGEVRCFLCPRDCKISSGNVGYCGVRKNIDGKLYSLIYDVVSSIANDPIEKKPLYHFYPGTKVLSVGSYGCNMRCGHCQNWQIAHIRSNDDFFKANLTTTQLVETCKKYDASGIAWTYNEPTIWFEYCLDGARLAKRNGLYTVWVTNGYIKIEALDMIAPYLDSYRVDIKGFSNDVYKKLAKINNFELILKATKHAKKLGMHIECITNIIPMLNDDDDQLRDIALWIKNELGDSTPWHVTKFVPYLEFSHLSPTPIETLEKARQIGFDAGLKYVYIGNVPGHKGEHTYCPKCKSLLIERIGYAIKIKGLNKDNLCENCKEKIPLFC